MILKKEKAPPVAPAGKYRAVVKQVVPKNARAGGTFIAWRFKITKGDFAGSDAEGTTPDKWLAGNKLDRWLRAAGVPDAKIDAKFDTDEVVGAKVRIEVTNESFQRKDGTPGVHAKVTDVTPRSSK